MAGTFFPGGAKALGVALLQTFQLSSLPLPLAIIIGGVGVGYTEEKLFRGALVPLLNNVLRDNKILIILVAGAAFALWHIAVYKITNNPALLVAGIFGSMMSFVVINQGDLRYSTLSHIIFNSVVIVAAFGISIIPLINLPLSSLGL